MKKINCILLVDDNKADNAFHSIKIRRAEVCDTIKVATSGKEALMYLEQADKKETEETRPDLIFLDINLPGMDGFEFLEEFHSRIYSLSNKPVIIMLTTSLNPDDQRKALAYDEVKKFVNKPLTVEIVRDAVQMYF